MAGLRLVTAAVAVVAAGSIMASVRATRAVDVDPVILDVVATDFSFDAPPAIAAGAVRIVFRNEGKELHHAWLVRLDGGHTRADFDAALAQPGPLPGWIVPVGGPNAPVPGGGETNATVVLRPGNYLWTCVIPGVDGQPHVMKGMTREMTVTGSATAELPKADAAIILSDYAFDLSKPLVRGRNTLRVVNYAAQPHEVEILRLAPGASVESVVAWVERPEGMPPAMPLGGVAPMGKTSNNIEIDLEPGRYLLICFVSDVKDGRPHFMHGMTKVITVE